MMNPINKIKSMRLKPAKLSGMVSLSAGFLLYPMPFSSSLVQAQALEEIIVTARKREESLQDTPISIQAFTADGLVARGITNAAEIGSFTPNMTFDRAATIGGSNNAAVVYIRGIGQDAAIPTIDLGVGTYIDGVYLARAVGGALDLIDVERIEVLRGPQGTLFGRNTIGGAINITTQKPNEEFRADTSLTFGSDELLYGQLTVNGALGENFFAKGSILSKNRDGYVDRPDGTDFGDEDMLAGNVAFRWLVSEDVTIDVSADASSTDSNGAPFTLLEVDATAAFPTFHNAFVAPPEAGCFTPQTGSTDSADPRCFNSQWVPNDTDTEFGTLPAEDKIDIWGVSGTVEWQINDNLIAKSITSYRDSEADYALDEDHSPLLLMHVTTASTHEQFTQEFQLLGTSFDQKLNWIVGAYYFEEEGEHLETITFPPVDFQSGGAVDNDSLALFAQGTYDFTEKWSLTFGLRYTDDTKRFTPDQFIVGDRNDRVPPPLVGFNPGQVPPIPPPGTPLLPNVEASIDTQETDPMVSLGYQWTEELLTYFTYSEGFKSGGFTQRVFPPQATIPAFDPEFVKVYEAGFKWQGFDNRMRLNGAYFFSDYEDLQIVSQSQSVAPLVQNAGAAEIRGFELDLQWVPGIDWLIEGGVGYIDGEYTDIDPGTGVGKGNDLVKTPEWSGFGSVSYTWDLGDRGKITPRLDFTYSDSYFSNAVNSPVTEQGSYSLVNFGVTYRSNDGRWLVTAMGRNLSDEEYISAGFSERNGPTSNLGITEVVRDRGKQWSIMIKHSFF